LKRGDLEASLALHASLHADANGIYGGNIENVETSEEMIRGKTTNARVREAFLSLSH
jgi:hypothetical protein